MTVRLLDGRVTAAAVRRELTQRAGESTATGGRTPGLGTVPAGDDPGRRANTVGRHRDRARTGGTDVPLGLVGLVGLRDCASDGRQAEDLRHEIGITVDTPGPRIVPPEPQAKHPLHSLHPPGPLHPYLSPAEEAGEVR